MKSRENASAEAPCAVASSVPAERFVYDFAGFTADPAKRLLAAEDGTARPISAKPFDALLHLLEHAGAVVSRADLAEALWPRTIVEDNNLSQTILAVRRALGDDGAQPQYVITVPRRGYQFVAPVRKRVVAPPVVAEVERGKGAAGSARTALARPWVLVVLALVAGAALLEVAEFLGGTGARPEAVADSDVRETLPRSVAVLPFRNLSPRPEDAYFAAGIHEEVLNQLARIRGVNVIGATSVARYAHEPASVSTIAAELRVGAIVEGSVRFAEERIRVSVRLLDVATSAEVWSEAYDTSLGDVLAVQAEVAAKIAAVLEPALADERRPVPQATESAEAYAAYLKALSLYRTNGGTGVSITPPVRRAIVAELEAALSHDPGFAAALAWRANVNVDALMFDRWPDAERDALVADLAQGIERDAAAAIALDPTLGVAHTALARLDMSRWRFDEARAAIDSALALSPGDSVLFHYRAMIDVLRDKPESAVHSARRALELDPKNPAPHSPLSMALRALGDLDGAASAFRRMIDVAPTASIGYIGLARTLTARDDDAAVLRTLRLAEQFLGDLRTFRLDAALSYARAGEREAAARLVNEFAAGSTGYRIDPALVALAALALGDYERAHAAVERAVGARATGVDPMPLAQIRSNAWNDPVLERPEWRALRASIAGR